MLFHAVHCIQWEVEGYVAFLLNEFRNKHCVKSMYLGTRQLE
jgi:hypothetical protein